ncbi:20494_t:CDS:2, partial [Gigaspora margarita]
LPAMYEYIDGYLENEYNALQASLKNLMNIVNYENILETCKMSHNVKFDIKFISKRWYTDPIQASDYSLIEGMAIEKLDSNEQINQLILICGSDTYQASIYTSITQKQEYAYGFSIAKSGLKFAFNNELQDLSSLEDKLDKSRQIIETDTEDKEEFEERSKK